MVSSGLGKNVVSKIKPGRIPYLSLRQTRELLNPKPTHTRKKARPPLPRDTFDPKLALGEAVDAFDRQFYHLAITFTTDQVLGLVKASQDFPLDDILDFYRRKKKKLFLRRIKFIFANNYVVFDRVLNDFTMRLLAPNRAYMTFRANYSWTENKFRGQLARGKGLIKPLFHSHSFFSSISSLLRGGFVFYYRRRYGHLYKIPNMRTAKAMNTRLFTLYMRNYIGKSLRRRLKTQMGKCVS